MRSAEVATAIRRRYGCETDDNIGPEWACLDEMDLQPGHSTRRIDLLMVRAWGGKPKGHERHAVEIKVSRSDLRSELENEPKWRAWWAVAHRFYLAVPDSLDLDGLDLPDEWGVVTVNRNGSREWRPARKHDADELPEPILIEAFRRASRAEARIRDAGADDPTAELAQLRKAITSAERASFTARRAEERWKDRAKDALRLYANVAPNVHCRCGAILKVAARPFGRGRSVGWEHDGEPGLDPMGREGDLCRYPSIDLDSLMDSMGGAA